MAIDRWLEFDPENPKKRGKNCESKFEEIILEILQGNYTKKYIYYIYVVFYLFIYFNLNTFFLYIVIKFLYFIY